MKKTNWIFGLLAVAIIPISFYISGDNRFYIFFDIPSLLIVFGGGYLLSLWAHGPSAIAKAYACAIKGATSDDAKTALAVFAGLQRHFIIMGIFGLLTGIIGMLANASDTGSISGGAIVTLLTPLYSIVAISVLVAPFKASVSTKVQE